MTEALVRPLKSPRNKELDHHLVEFLQLGEVKYEQQSIAPLIILNEQFLFSI